MHFPAAHTPLRRCSPLSSPRFFLFLFNDEYVAAKAPAASLSLWLPSGTWRRNKKTDQQVNEVPTTPSANAKIDDGAEVPDHEPPPFDPVLPLDRVSRACRRRMGVGWPSPWPSPRH